MPSLPGPRVPAMADLEADHATDPDLLNTFDFERRAAALLPTPVLAYYAGGALDERTLNDNRAAFERRSIMPRVMTDVSAVETSVEVLGRMWPLPFWICPLAMHRLAHPDGELATARAAARRGVTMVESTSASTDLAEVAAVGGRPWFQVYLPEDAGARRALIERAVDSGYEALMLTVDLQRVGRRERDLRSGFSIPADLGLPNLARAAGVEAHKGAEVSFTARLTWDDLEWLTKFRLPVFVKGILRADDALLALEHGAAGIVISNHGGRQLDGAIASLDALEPIAAAVDHRAPILFDGGIRRGHDALIALAMGATAVGIGRPILWGLTVAGEAGVGRVLDLLAAELELAMALAGIGRLGDLTPDLIRSR